MTMTQKKGESVHSYISNVQALCKRVDKNMNDCTVLTHIREGLDDSLKPWISNKNPKTVAESMIEVQYISQFGALNNNGANKAGNGLRKQRNQRRRNANKAESGGPDDHTRPASAQRDPQCPEKAQASESGRGDDTRSDGGPTKRAKPKSWIENKNGNTKYTKKVANFDKGKFTWRKQDPKVNVNQPSKTTIELVTPSPQKHIAGSDSIVDSATLETLLGSEIMNTVAEISGDVQDGNKCIVIRLSSALPIPTKQPAKSDSQRLFISCGCRPYLRSLTLFHLITFRISPYVNTISMTSQYLSLLFVIFTVR